MLQSECVFSVSVGGVGFFRLNVCLVSVTVSVSEVSFGLNVSLVCVLVAGVCCNVNVYLVCHCVSGWGFFQIECVLSVCNFASGWGLF